MKPRKGTAKGWAMPIPGRKHWRLCVLVEIVSEIADPYDADREAERLARGVAAVFGKRRSETRTPDAEGAGDHTKARPEEVSHE